MNSVTAVLQGLVFWLVFFLNYLFLLTMDVQVQEASAFSELQLSYRLNDFCLAQNFAVRMRLVAATQSFCFLPAELRDLC